MRGSSLAPFNPANDRPAARRATSRWPRLIHIEMRFGRTRLLDMHDAEVRCAFPPVPRPDAAPGRVPRRGPESFRRARKAPLSFTARNDERLAHGRCAKWLIRMRWLVGYLLSSARARGIDCRGVDRLRRHEVGLSSLMISTYNPAGIRGPSSRRAPRTVRDYLGSRSRGYG
jgi:hypothetical protein